MSLPAEKLAILAAEIADDPLGRGYAAMSSDVDIVADINAAYRTGFLSVDAASVRQAAMMSMAYPAIEDLCTDATATKEQRYAARIFVKTVEPGSFQQFHMNDAAIRTAITNQFALILASGAITQDQHDAILGTATGSISRATELGIDGLDHLDVAKAKGNF